MPRKSVRKSRKIKTRRRKLRGGDDVQGTLKRKNEIYFKAKPQDEYRKIANDMNADGEFANKYGATYEREMIVIKDTEDTPRAWIYNLDKSQGYMLLDSEIEYTPEQIADMASVYRRYLKL